MDRQTFAILELLLQSKDGQTDICNFRVAFATEKHFLIGLFYLPLKEAITVLNVRI